MTHEERLPLNSPGDGGVSGATDENLNTRPSSGSLASSTTGPDSIVSKSNIARARSEEARGAEEQESAVDTGTVNESESHSEHTDEEELWMGPWNNLHIPMTKL